MASTNDALTALLAGVQSEIRLLRDSITAAKGSSELMIAAGEAATELAVMIRQISDQKDVLEMKNNNLAEVIAQVTSLAKSLKELNTNTVDLNKALPEALTKLSESLSSRISTKVSEALPSTISTALPPKAVFGEIAANLKSMKDQQAATAKKIDEAFSKLSTFVDEVKTSMTTTFTNKIGELQVKANTKEVEKLQELVKEKDTAIKDLEIKLETAESDANAMQTRIGALSQAAADEKAKYDNLQAQLDVVRKLSNAALESNKTIMSQDTAEITRLRSELSKRKWSD